MTHPPRYSFNKGPDLTITNLGKSITIHHLNQVYTKTYPHAYQGDDLCQALMMTPTAAQIITELPLYGFRIIAPNEARP